MAPLVAPSDLLRFRAMLRVDVGRGRLSRSVRLASAVRLRESARDSRDDRWHRAGDRTGRPVDPGSNARPGTRRSFSSRTRHVVRLYARDYERHRINGARASRKLIDAFTLDRSSGVRVGAVSRTSIRQVRTWRLSNGCT